MHVTSSIVINRAAVDVFDYVADMSKNPQWQNGQVTCGWTSRPPRGLGATYDQEARFLGKSIVSSFTVTEFAPGRLIRIVSTSGPMDIDVTRSVEPISDRSCTVIAHVRGSVPAPMKLLGPLLRAIVRSSVNKDYQRLKTLLETEPVEAAG